MFGRGCYLQGLLHEPARPREGGEYEDARVLVVLAGHELLGHKVHPVAERGDQGHLDETRKKLPKKMNCVS